jgi:hypothetical protein
VKVTPQMGDAWVAYVTAETIPMEWDWSKASRMLKHAFLSGYVAAQADRSPQGQDAERLDAEHESAVPEEGCAQGEALSGRIRRK